MLDFPDVVERVKVLSDKNSLKLHIGVVHSYEDKAGSSNSQKCEICSKDLSSKKYLEIHIKSVHQGIKDYICTICDQRFGTPCTLRDHKTIH